MIEYKVKAWSNGNKEWYLNGKLHREDGPAVERANGYKEWRLNDKLHREDGPAVEYASGTKEWYLNGKRHREDGPAVERASGDKMWFLDGQQLTEDEHWLVTPTKPPSTPCAQTLSAKVVEIDGKKYKLTEV